MIGKSSIKHLEDLPTKDFLEAIEALDEFEVTEKIDGFQLIFGFENGEFYTSREAKSGKRYFSPEQYPFEFWSTAFKSAHAALENIAPALKKHIGNNVAIEIELLFGKCPNIIPYNPDDINRIVLLKNIQGNTDLQKLKNKFDDIVSVDVQNIAITKHGYDKQSEKQSHAWKFEVVPKITNLKLPHNDIKPISDHLHQYVSENNNAELEITRITKNNKQQIQSVRDKIQDMKNQIKQLLVKQVIRQQTSAFGPDTKHGGWIEGFVFRHPVTGKQFKLVDKEKFTKINKHQHHIQNEVRKANWIDLKKSLRECVGVTQIKLNENQKYIEDLTPIAMQIQNKSFEDLKNGMNKILNESYARLINSLMALPGKREFINQNNIQKILSEYSELLDKNRNIRQEIWHATCIEHLIEIAITQQIKLPHGKNFKDNCRPIKKSELKETLKYIATITGVDSKELGCNLLGSTGKLDESNDIDICIDQTVHEPDVILANVKKYLPEVKTNNTGGLNILQLVVPVKGLEQNGFVQCDLMFSRHTAWTKFYYDSNPTQSAYKGAYRNILLRAIVSSSNATKYENNELIERQGSVIVPDVGMVYQKRERRIGIKGKRLKSFIVTESGKEISSPSEIVNVIFNYNNVTPNDVNTFERLWQKTTEAFEPGRLDVIKEIAIKIFSDGKYKIPKEFRNVV